MKIVVKKIGREREQKALSDRSKSGFPVAFGDKNGFESPLRVTIIQESCNKTTTFEIDKEFLPNNKTNTTRFYLQPTTTATTQIKWCSKVANHMKQIL